MKVLIQISTKMGLSFHQRLREALRDKIKCPYCSPSHDLDWSVYEDGESFGLWDCGIVVRLNLPKRVLMAMRKQRLDEHGNPLGQYIKGFAFQARPCFSGECRRITRSSKEKSV